MNSLTSSTLRLIQSISQGEEIASGLDEVMDDTVRRIVTKIRDQSTMKETPLDAFGGNASSLEAFMENSSIGKLAKSMCDDILKNGSGEIDAFKNMGMEGGLDFNKLFDTSSNNPLAGLIENVTKNVNDQISSGNLDQEVLLKEAFGIFNQLNVDNDGGDGSDGGQNLLMNQRKGGMSL
jgi:hypothetical protein